MQNNQKQAKQFEATWEQLEEIVEGTEQVLLKFKEWDMKNMLGSQVFGMERGGRRGDGG